MGKKQHFSEPEADAEDDSFDHMEFAAVSDFKDELKKSIREVKSSFINNTVRIRFLWLVREKRCKSILNV